MLNMDLKIIEYNREKICQVSLFGQNRSKEVIEYQLKVFEKLGNFPLNHFLCPMPGRSYGSCLDEVVERIHNKVDYIFVFDSDSFPLQSNYLERAYDKVKDKEGVAGCAFRNAHKDKSNWEWDHISCGPPIIFSIKLWNDLGRPSLDHHGRMADTLESMTFECKAKGKGVYIWYPTEVLGRVEQTPKEIPDSQLKPPLEPGIYFGNGTTYSNLFFHAMNANLPGHVEMFVKKAKEVLG